MSEPAQPPFRLRDGASSLRPLAAALVPLAVAAWVVFGEPSRESALVGLGMALAVSIGLVVIERAALANRLRTVSAVIAAFREGDMSIRVRPKGAGDLLGDVASELNTLGDTLRAHRLGELEAWALLRKVMAEVDVVVLAWSDDGTLRLANDAAARTLGATSADLLGKRSAELGLETLLEGPAPRVVKDCVPLGAGPWELRRGTFRLAGETHTLVVLSDVSLALREQEREAWKRIIRVMGHEINNSLAPIRSISDNLSGLLAKEKRDADWEADVASGLSVIGRRAEALGRFMTAYATLARLPPPKLGTVQVGAWAARVTALEQRIAVSIPGGPDVAVAGDADQLDQLLINLVKNAAEASLERGGGVRVRWSVEGRSVEIAVEDDGPGVTDTANLFVPFFTTKSNGSGIGLALARQIAEAHGGSLTLTSRDGAPGALARVRLPLAKVQPGS